MVKIELTNQEWYFLHVQIEKIIKENNPDNYLAKDIFNKIVENLPKIEDIKYEFQQEYESVWNNPYIKGKRLTDKESSYMSIQDNNFNQEEFEEAIKPFINNSQ